MEEEEAEAVERREEKEGNPGALRHVECCGARRRGESGAVPNKRKHRAETGTSSDARGEVGEGDGQLAQLFGGVRRFGSV